MIQSCLKTITIWLTTMLVGYFIVLLSVVNAQTNYTTIERFSANNGLPNATIFSIHKHSSGYIILGSNNGLIRYDGYDFDLFTQTKNNLATKGASNLFIDSKQRIWTGTWGEGLTIYDQQLKLLHRFDPKHSPINLSKIQTFFEDDQHNIWVGTNGGGLLRFIESSHQFIQYKHQSDDPHSLSHDRVWSITQTDTNTLWIGTSKGLNQLNMQTGRVNRFYPPTTTERNQNTIRALFAEPQRNRLWIGTDQGLRWFNLKQQKFKPVTNTHFDSHLSINIFKADGLGALWIGTHSGLLNYDLTTQQFNTQSVEQSKTLFKGDDIRDIYFDNNQLMWIATRYAGLIKVNVKNSDIFRLSHYLDHHGQLKKTGHIFALFKDHKGVIWVGTSNKLLYIAANTSEAIEYITDIPLHFITSISETSQGEIWIGDNQGLIQLNSQRNKLTRRNDLLNPLDIKSIESLHVDKNDHLWIGSKDDGLLKLHDNQLESILISPELPKKFRVNHIFEDSRHQLWVVPEAGGVYRIDLNGQPSNKSESFRDFNQRLSHHQIDQIYQSSDHNIWFASQNYLNRYSDQSNQLVWFGTKNGIGSNVIKSIIEDDHNDLWFATGAGLSQYNSINNSFNNYSVADGLAKNSYKIDAAVKNHQGKLYFAGDHGIDIITPSKMQRNRHQPQVYLTKIWVDNQLVKHSFIPTSEPLSLDHQIKSIRFEFAALDFQDPSKNHYSYKLENFEPQWHQPTTQRHANYTNLKPGKYVLRLKGSNNNGVWNEASHPLHLTITPPIYQSLPFYLIVTLVVIATIYLNYIYRGRQQHWRKQLLQSEVKAKTRDLKMLSTIGRQLNATLDLEAIFKLLYQQMTETIDVQYFAIGLLSPDGSEINYDHVIEKGKNLDKHTYQVADEQLLSSWCIRNVKEVVIRKPQDIEQYVSNYRSMTPSDDNGSMVYLPLMGIDKKVAGCITIQSVNPNAFSPAQISMLRTLASYTAIAINNARAYAKLEQQNQAIVSAQQQLIEAEKMASLGELTAGVAHEINNPTNFVFVSSQNMAIELEKFQQFIEELMSDEADEQISACFTQWFDNLFEHLHTIEDGSQRIKMIVQDLRAFSRLDVVERQPIAVAKCIESTLHLVQTQYIEGVEFDVQYDSKPSIECNISQINQVIMNILVNACDAICERDTHQFPGKVLIRVSKEQDKVKISINDNGPGMNEDTKQKLFQPFFTTKAVGKGTGLGLSISFGIISDHQGSIEVESQINQGTTFIVTLPCYQSQS